LVTVLSLAFAALMLRRAMAVCGGLTMAAVKPVYEVRTWLKSALPLMLMGGMFLANMNTDILMLGAMVGPEAAAVYKAATRGAELVVFSLSIIIIPLAPLIAKLHTSGDFERLQKGITKSAKVVFLFSLLTAIPLLVFGKFFLSMFGSEFTQGRIALNILIAGQLVNSTMGISGAVLVMCGLEKKAALGLFFGFIVNIISNVLLIPIWGINGAAVATCISTILWTSTLSIFVVKNLKLNPTFFNN
jgi:O-antigen/teichoic acid export membrane protein